MIFVVAWESGFKGTEYRNIKTNYVTVLCTFVYSLTFHYKYYGALHLLHINNNSV